MRKRTMPVLLAALMAAVIIYAARPAEARAPMQSYKVLEPIQQGNLTIFPVIAPTTHDTSRFMTLDDGLRSGEVVITEAGRVSTMIRRPLPVPHPQGSGAEVNRLVLLNNSDRPLLLLAGEIVTGGKQDRVVGRDRIVPPKSDPVDLSVFCVEPGRWTGTTDKFGATTAQMAQPSVRSRAMADRNQAQVWEEVRSSRAKMAAAAPRAAGVVGGTTSYAHTIENSEVKQEIDKVAAPIERSYETVMKQLKERNAVGVVVAINGRLIWADIFASEALLQKYWPKLVRSYAAESLTAVHDTKTVVPDVASAQAFLNNMNGEREVTETEPDIFRETEVQGVGFKVFRLTSLLPKTDYEVHVAKMTTSTAEPVEGTIRRR